MSSFSSLGPKSITKEQLLKYLKHDLNTPYFIGNRDDPNRVAEDLTSRIFDGITEMEINQKEEEENEKISKNPKAVKLKKKIDVPPGKSLGFVQNKKTGKISYYTKGDYKYTPKTGKLENKETGEIIFPDDDQYLEILEKQFYVKVEDKKLKEQHLRVSRRQLSRIIKQSLLDY